ncbi:bublin coiled-coil protein isoform X1 [Ascaphus truei]|uniref:bublin coiled-coil protein isoform X1 n=1 Tax=Ascaphus truei TaxID=8439 RepID=UPI003F59BE0D
MTRGHVERRLQLWDGRTQRGAPTTGGSRRGARGGRYGEEDYAAVDFMLDQISFCLDHLEEKNDLLHAQLQDLLESNRQARRDFQKQRNHSGSSTTEEQGATL